MKRSVLVGVGASLLSFVLLIAAWAPAIAFAAHNTSHLAKNTNAADPERNFRLSEKTELLDELLIQPGISICVGAFVGFLASRSVKLVAALSLAPQLLFFLYGNSWSAKESILAVVYLMVGVFVAGAIRAWHHRSSGQQNGSSAPAVVL